MLTHCGNNVRNRYSGCVFSVKDIVPVPLKTSRNQLNSTSAISLRSFLVRGVNPRVAISKSLLTFCEMLLRCCLSTRYTALGTSAATSLPDPRILPIDANPKTSLGFLPANRRTNAQISTPLLFTIGITRMSRLTGVLAGRARRCTHS